MKTAHMVAWILVIIGGLNWLLVGLAGWDIGQLFGGQEMAISRVIYVLVGLSAIYEVVTHKASCKMCSSMGSSSSSGGSMPR